MFNSTNQKMVNAFSGDIATIPCYEAYSWLWFPIIEDVRPVNGSVWIFLRASSDEDGHRVRKVISSEKAIEPDGDFSCSIDFMIKSKQYACIATPEIHGEAVDDILIRALHKKSVQSTLENKPNIIFPSKQIFDLIKDMESDPTTAPQVYKDRLLELIESKRK